ncbi:hypothetical protein Acsp03_65050 [Actinomadura sp. NBRC 104412]|nr:hypothetical protein Acsp03_65050 [Actinomadura sp. NBRC 104412]
MLLTSRSYAEYRAMFDLTDADLTGVTLDCAAGGSSFAAKSAGDGARAIAMDPLYAQGARAVAGRLPADLARCEEMFRAERRRFVWDWYGSPDRHKEMRRAAASEFLADLRRHPGRYVAAGLPRLPLADASADLVLCSHLLFTWARDHDRDWHRRAILEMCRVSRREVRIFPLVHMGHGEPVGFLDALRADIEAATGAHSECPTVPYELQRGANRMLRIYTAPETP